MFAGVITVTPLDCKAASERESSGLCVPASLPQALIIFLHVGEPQTLLLRCCADSFLLNQRSACSKNVHFSGLHRPPLVLTQKEANSGTLENNAKHRKLK